MLLVGISLACHLLVLTLSFWFMPMLTLPSCWAHVPSSIMLTWLASLAGLGLQINLSPFDAWDDHKEHHAGLMSTVVLCWLHRCFDCKPTWVFSDHGVRMLMAEEVYLETDFHEYKIYFIVITVIISLDIQCWICAVFILIVIMIIIMTNITIIIITTILSESSQTNCLVR